jgi:hypothetical protein
MTTPRVRLRRGDWGRAAIALAGGAIGLEIASAVVPSFDVGGWDRALFASLGIAIWGALLRPILVRLAVLFGWIGAILVGLFGQAFVVWFAVYQPGADVTLFGSLAAAWIVAAVTTLLGYLATAGTDDAVTASILRRARRHRNTVSDPEVPGILFVQIDGLPFPVAEWSVRAGTLPTLSRWVRDGTHHLVEWRPKLPATTPASQMGILHGTIDGIPGFRWVDREEGRIYVANKPRDAKLIEARHSDGRGLLADDGVSVSNLFTGDAVTAYATMSAVDRTQETRDTRLALSQFLASPVGLARCIPRMFTEMVRERFQSRRARHLDIRPRVERGWGFRFERAGLSGLLRDLNTALVAQEMLRGRKAIYVDYVDYDAVAHHAGIVRPESLDTLTGLDAILARLARVAEVAPRKYHIVVLSDHGQSQGEVFADRYGEDLATLVARLADAVAVGTAENREGAGTLNSMIAGSASDDSVVGRALGRTAERVESQTLSTDAAQELEQQAARDEFIVFGSGNLGLIYVAGEKHKLTAEQLAERFPALVSGLAEHPGVGFVVVEFADAGPVVIGARGTHRLRDATVTGEDPLLPFGPDAAEFVLRAASMPESPDIYVNSLLDELGEVAAFEGLVGCHGGLGGWQDRAALCWPVELPGPTEMIVGADALHRVLVGWLELLGHRKTLDEVPVR